MSFRQSVSVFYTVTVTNDFLGILFDARFDANLGIPEPLFGVHRHSLLLVCRHGDFNEALLGLGHCCYCRDGELGGGNVLPTESEQFKCLSIRLYML
jgi:hypothetical protein